MPRRRGSRPEDSARLLDARAGLPQPALLLQNGVLLPGGAKQPFRNGARHRDGAAWRDDSRTWLTPSLDESPFNCRRSALLIWSTSRSGAQASRASKSEIRTPPCGFERLASFFLGKCDFRSLAHGRHNLPGPHDFAFPLPIDQVQAVHIGPEVNSIGKHLLQPLLGNRLGPSPKPIGIVQNDI